MPIAYLMLAIVVVLPAAYFAYDWFKVRKAKRWLLANWGSEAALRRPDDEQVDDIAEYWRALHGHEAISRFVDDITWNDLDMNQVLRQVDRSRSMLGSEALYAMLRRQDASLEQLKTRESLANALNEDEDFRLRVQQALHGIGYRAFHGASRYLYSAAYQYPPHRWVYPLLGLLPICLLLLGLLDVRFVLAAGGVFAVNLFVYYRTQKTWEKELASIRHIGAVIRTAQRLARMETSALEPIALQLKELHKKLWAIRRWLPLFGMETLGDAGMLLDYLKIFFMLDMVSLGAIVGELNKRGDEVRQLYALVSEVDACLSIAQLEHAHPHLCRPQFCEDKQVQAQGIRHPLVINCVPNDLTWQRHMLISGSNASGKSTFIKAVAVNCVLAQSLYLCWADSFHMRRGTVMSSMAVRDNITDGESYFMVELKSLKRILDAVEKEGMIYCLVDEILRGTNTIERIAASSAVLRSLAGREVLCMTATHDIELTRMLDTVYDNNHFSEKVDEQGVTFDYLLKQGPTRTRNALRLLRQMGYETALVDTAEQTAAAFEAQEQWPTL